jgi:putative membrane protein
MHRTITMVGVLVLAILTASAAAQTGIGSSGNFVTQAAHRGLANAELSQLALQRSQSPDVRRLARHMVDEQMRAYDDLLALAGQAGLETPDQIDLEQRTVKSRLAALSGTAFDRDYLQALHTNQERDIALFRGYAKSGEDPGLKDWATHRLPALRRDQQLTDTVARDVGR